MQIELHCQRSGCKNPGTAGAPSPTETEADRQPHFDFANFCHDPEAWLGTVSIFLFEVFFPSNAFMASARSFNTFIRRKHLN